MSAIGVLPVLIEYRFVRGGAYAAAYAEKQGVGISLPGHCLASGQRRVSRHKISSKIAVWKSPIITLHTSHQTLMFTQSRECYAAADVALRRCASKHTYRSCDILSSVPHAIIQRDTALFANPNDRAEEIVRISVKLGTIQTFHIH